MFLSLLKINLGNDPNHPGRIWLRNIYHVHQRLCMAFPSAFRKGDDPNFLKPYKPEDFGDKQVRVARKKEAGFLFRIDPQPSGRVALLAQSAIQPDWDYAFHNADYLLAAPPQVKPFDPGFLNGERLRFRLVANPTKKIDTIKKETRQNLSNDELRAMKGRHGKRVPVRTEDLHEWLSGRAERGGFSLDGDSVAIQAGHIYVKKPGERGNRLRSVRYEGRLEITNSGLFQETLIRGIGPGKAFGFGLLSVAPVRSFPPEEQT